MTLRVKTVEYVCDTQLAQVATNTTLATSTTHVFPAITCSFPESGSRQWKSVIGEFTFNDAWTVVTNIAAFQAGISSGSVSASYVNKNFTYAAQTNTGDHEHNIYLVDFTDEVTENKFNINQVSASSAVYQISVTVSTAAASFINNIACKLAFTYEYEDSVATKYLKTVRIPIQSQQGVLVVVDSELGTSGSCNAPRNQIPALATFLPETSGRVINQAWIEMWSNGAGAAATDFSCSYRIDNSGTSVPRALYEMALNAGTMTRDIWIWNTASYVIDVSHSFNVASSLTAKFATMGGFMGVTYEYTAASSSNPIRLNSLIVGTEFKDKSFYISPSSSRDMDFQLTELYVPEDDPVLKQSAMMYHVMAPGGAQFGIRAGNQLPNSGSYLLTALVNQGGQMVFHRIDHSGGFSLTKGKNVLTSSHVANGASSISLWGQYAYINYTSVCSKLGEGAHNSTTTWMLASTSLGYGPNFGELGTSKQRTPNIPEPKYFLNSCLYEYYLRNANNQDFSLHMSVTSSEYVNSGWIAAIPITFNWNDAELNSSRFTNDAISRFNRYPEITGTMENKMNIELPKRYRAHTGVQGYWALRQYVTYHSVTSSICGTITGSAGGTVNLNLMKLSDYSVVLKTERTGNGAFSMSFYDSTANDYVVIAREDTTHKGISATGTPGESTFDIVLSSSGGGSGTTIVASNYAFIG